MDYLFYALLLMSVKDPAHDLSILTYHISPRYLGPCKISGSSRKYLRLDSQQFFCDNSSLACAHVGVSEHQGPLLGESLYDEDYM